VDTSRYDDDTFDAVVAFGGPLSYAFEYDATALSGLFRIVKPGGVVVASVMSLLGSWRYFLGAVVGDMNTAGDEPTNRVFSTGDIRHIESEHICQMYRGSDIERLVANCRGTLLAMSASNWASLGDVAALNELESSSERWRVFLEQEIQSCAEPGAVDGGTHLLFAARPLAS
jgi:SAM-dependent methyltransferase